MSENVGAIEYYIDADTQGLLTAEKMVDKSTKRMESDFNRTGKSVDKFNTRMSKTAQGVNKSMGGMGRSAGQVGIQFQQLVGQIQGGQNAMAALSMQAADIGIVMGAPLLGAVAGLAAAFGGALVPSLFDSKDATEELEEAQKKLGETIELNADGVPVLTEKIRELAKVSKEAALVELAQANIDALDLIRKSAAGIGESINDEINIDKAISGFERYQAAIEAGGASAEAALAIVEGRVATQDEQFVNLQSTIRGLNREFDLSFEQSTRFIDAVNRVKTEGTPEAIRNLQSTLTDLNGEFGNNNKSLITLQSSMRVFFEQAMKGGQTLQELEKWQKNFDEMLNQTSESATSATTSLNRMIESLVTQANTVGMSEREIAKYMAALAGASEGQLKNIDILYDYIEGKEAEIEADEKARKAKESAIEKYERLTQKMREQYAVIVEGQDPFEMQINAYRQVAQQAGISADQIQRNIDKMRELKAEQAAQKEEESTRRADPFADDPVLGGQGDDFLSGGQMDQLEKARQRNQALKELEEEATETVRQQEQQRNQIRMANLQNMSNIFGSVADVLKNSEGEQSGAYKSLLALQKGFAIASSIVAIQTNIANASKVGFPQNIPLIAGAVSQTAGILSTIKGASMGGGRLYGGGVEGGKLYPVTEDGRPELLTQGNKQYLLPGSNGRVTSNRDMMQGGGQAAAPIINVNNYSGSQVDVQSRQQGGGMDARQVIDIVVGDINSRQRVHNAITRTTSANNKVRGG